MSKSDLFYDLYDGQIVDIRTITHPVRGGINVAMYENA